MLPSPRTQRCTGQPPSRPLFHLIFSATLGGRQGRSGIFVVSKQIRKMNGRKEEDYEPGESWCQIPFLSSSLGPFEWKSARGQPQENTWWKQKLLSPCLTQMLPPPSVNVRAAFLLPSSFFSYPCIPSLSHSWHSSHSGKLCFWLHIKANLYLKLSASAAPYAWNTFHEAGFPTLQGFEYLLPRGTHLLINSQTPPTPTLFHLITLLCFFLGFLKI